MKGQVHDHLFTWNRYLAPAYNKLTRTLHWYLWSFQLLHLVFLTKKRLWCEKLGLILIITHFAWEHKNTKSISEYAIHDFTGRREQSSDETVWSKYKMVEAIKRRGSYSLLGKIKFFTTHMIYEIITNIIKHIFSVISVFFLLSLSIAEMPR